MLPKRIRPRDAHSAGRREHSKTCAINLFSHPPTARSEVRGLPANAPAIWTTHPPTRPAPPRRRKRFYIQFPPPYIAVALGRSPPGAEFMLVHVLKSKIHRAQVTAGDVNYEGSLGIARDLMDKVGLLPYEKILCGNMANGERFETYAIPAEPGSGQVILNGATARLGKPGDRLTIMSFTEVDAAAAKSWKPQVIVLGEQNAVVSERGL